MKNFDTDLHSDEEIKNIYRFKNIAVVGMSRNEEKAACGVPKYLIEKGYNVIPVNPNTSEILGRKSHDRISDISEQVDVVDIFRRSEDVYPVIEDVIKKKGIKVVWLQEGIHNIEAENLARINGIDVVYNRCMLAEHIRLML